MEPWYVIAVLLITPLMRVLFRRDFRGQHNIPVTGGVILAVNHVSVADPFAVALFVHEAGRRPRFMAKASVFRIPVAGRILRGVHQIPVDRQTADARLSLAAAASAIRSGEAVVIYPEGTTTRDPDCWPMRGRTGVARLAMETAAPVVPIAVWGPQDFLGRGGRLRPLPRKTLSVRAGPPVDLIEWIGAPASAAALQACTDAVMGEVTELVAELRGEVPPAVPFDPAAAVATRPDDHTRRSA